MVQVTLLDTMELATFCVRTFSLHKVNPFAVLRLHHKQTHACPLLSPECSVQGRSEPLRHLPRS